MILIITGNKDRLKKTSLNSLQTIKKTIESELFCSKNFWLYKSVTCYIKNYLERRIWIRLKKKLGVTQACALLTRPRKNSLFGQNIKYCTKFSLKKNCIFRLKHLFDPLLWTNLRIENYLDRQFHVFQILSRVQIINQTYDTSIVE